MKEKENKNEYNQESKKDKIFQVLNKKRKPDNSIKDLNLTPKKKIFILYKPKNDFNTKQNIISQKKSNENLINELNFINNNNIQKNLNISIIRNSPKNSPKKNNDNKIENNILNNNNINNNNFNQIIKKKNLKININIIKNDEITESTKNDNQNNITFGDYICYKDNQIGSGSFGEVLYGKHKNKSLEVAVKIINTETSLETIDREINFTKALQNEIGFPVIYYTGIQDNKNIIIESLLGPSLDKLFRYCGKIFPLKTVCLIGKEMVKRLESMHEKGILHRDLKPNNLTWGNYNNSYNNILNCNLKDDININNKLDTNTIYLIDFGLSCSFYEHGLTTRHYKIKNGFNFVGTLRYASLNSHKGIRQGRRDDLESMMYILIYFLKGKLPWQDVKAKKKEERHKLIFQIKSKTSIESLCKELPNEFSDLLNYVKSLQFDEKPSYCKFYAYFYNLISKMNNEQIQEKNFNYIWEKILVDNMNKYEENKDVGIIQEAEKIVFKGYPINLRNFTNYLIYNNKSKK